LVSDSARKFSIVRHLSQVFVSTVDTAGELSPHGCDLMGTSNGSVTLVKSNQVKSNEVAFNK